jgi:hypothetical protein
VFKYARASRGGEIFSEYESLVSNWKPGDELLAAGNVHYRATAVVPQERMHELIEQPLYALLEVEPLA